MAALEVHQTVVSSAWRDVAVMFQRATLLEWRTAVGNVLLPTELRRTVTAQDNSRVKTLLKLVDFEYFAFSFPAQLSEGMQQRVALARLRQTGVDTLLLDEPFGALAEFTRKKLNLVLLRSVSEVKATTIFFSTTLPRPYFWLMKFMSQLRELGRADMRYVSRR